MKQEGTREDFGIWRCSACTWLYKYKDQKIPFEDLPDDGNVPSAKWERPPSKRSPDRSSPATRRGKNSQ